MSQVRRGIAAIACVALIAGCAAPLRRHRPLTIGVAVAVITTIVIAVPVTTGCTPGPDCNTTTHLQTLGLAALAGPVLGTLIGLEVGRGQEAATVSASPITTHGAERTEVNACIDAGARTELDLERRCPFGLASASATTPLCSCERRRGYWDCEVSTATTCRTRDDAAIVAIGWGRGKVKALGRATRNLRTACAWSEGTLAESDHPSCQCDSASFRGELCVCQVSGVCS
jgi:hypothetical protein